MKPRRKLSIGVKAWMMTCKIIMGKRPKLMSLQNCMPSLPVPSVTDTMKRVSVFLFNLVN